MPTSMTQVRSMLPARLRGARFATIARDPSFRRYFASGDHSATIRAVLKRLFEAGRNGRRRATLDRQLEKEARSRRALAGVCQRRQRAQHVAQELAPVVQAVDSRARRLANRQARIRTLNLIRRRQRAQTCAMSIVDAMNPIDRYALTRGAHLRMCAPSRRSSTLVRTSSQ